MRRIGEDGEDNSEMDQRLIVTKQIFVTRLHPSKDIRRLRRLRRYVFEASEKL